MSLPAGSRWNSTSKNRRIQVLEISKYVKDQSVGINVSLLYVSKSAVENISDGHGSEKKCGDTLIFQRYIFLVPLGIHSIIFWKIISLKIISTPNY